MEISFSIISLIQSMLAPGVMISACALLLLGMNNKYSLVVNRIRLLNEEKRKFRLKASESKFKYEDEVRLNSLSIQLSQLRNRAMLVRNAVFCYSIAVASFVITSLIIGFNFLFTKLNVEFFVVVIFMFGMILVLAGVMFATWETINGYRIISYEVKVDE